MIEFPSPAQTPLPHRGSVSAKGPGAHRPACSACQHRAACKSGFKSLPVGQTALVALTGWGREPEGPADSPISLGPGIPGLRYPGGEGGGDTDTSVVDIWAVPKDLDEAGGGANAQQNGGEAGEGDRHQRSRDPARSLRCT